VKALTGLTGEVTPASVTNALNTMKPVPMVMGGGIEMQCGAKKVAITPNVCSTEALTANLDKSGNASGYKTLETGDITKLGG
jgi:branched-chain amino acid transport system substrate-binding protein